MKRGTIKRFREYLNAKFRDSGNWKHNQFHQISREYGDYLYFQDRDMFNALLTDAQQGAEQFKDFQT